MTTDAPPAALAESQPIQWRLRLTSWLLSRLKGDDTEKETAIEMLVAGLSEARNEGIDDAAIIVERLRDNCAGDRAAVLSIAATALRNLAKKNRSDSA